MFYFSQPVSFNAGSFSFFKKSALDKLVDSQSVMALSGTSSIDVFQEVEFSLYAKLD
jgi:hypothetical protein